MGLSPLDKGAGSGGSVSNEDEVVACGGTVPVVEVAVKITGDINFKQGMIKR